jgi:hypothetical protein
MLKQLRGERETVMTAHVKGVTLPTDAGVDVEIKIHTRLNISAYVAKQRANVCLVLYCGQNFCVMVFVATGPLRYWHTECLHALVVTGITEHFAADTAVSAKWRAAQR